MRCRFCKKQIYRVYRPGADKYFWLSDETGTHCCFGEYIGGSWTHLPEEIPTLQTAKREFALDIELPFVEYRLLEKVNGKYHTVVSGTNREAVWKYAWEHLRINRYMFDRLPSSMEGPGIKLINAPEELSSKVLVTAFITEMQLLNDGCSSEEEFCVEAMKLVDLLVKICKGIEPVPQDWVDHCENKENL